MLKSDPAARVPPANRLLAALPPKEYARLLPYLELVQLAFKEILHHPGRPLPHVHFPCSGVVSLLLEMPPGDSIEVGIVGREGMLGLPVLLNSGTSLTRSLVQVPGEALRMTATDFVARVKPGCPLHKLLLRYAGASLGQVWQSLACNALHPVKKRLCRWLLMTHGRVEADHFPLTHEFLAAMLGVRRPTVTAEAKGLQARGLIRYKRGQVTILDRDRLEKEACECHRIVQQQLEQALA